MSNICHMYNDCALCYYALAVSGLNRSEVTQERVQPWLKLGLSPVIISTARV